ncbi:hypothetical protein PN36_05005 [Candidatus Thiomargarita nelsonii]|uniref:Uncharacterized protein n=1 Tax=Candidatus Thiomargarita nelsonii TaxID=1003181 RepID=A0A4E0QX29_9GAMM|nr:hypothetical protein PN36_05005 [Candidatus Thiomargarita nelsonii]
MPIHLLFDLLAYTIGAILAWKVFKARCLSGWKSQHLFFTSTLSICQFVFLEYKALALSDSTKLKLCTPTQISFSFVRQYKAKALYSNPNKL